MIDIILSKKIKGHQKEYVRFGLSNDLLNFIHSTYSIMNKLFPSFDFNNFLTLTAYKTNNQLIINIKSKCEKTEELSQIKFNKKKFIYQYEKIELSIYEVLKKYSLENGYKIKKNKNQIHLKDGIDLYNKNEIYLLCKNKYLGI